MFEKYWLRDIRTSPISCEADKDIDRRLYPIAIQAPQAPFALGITAGYISEEFAKTLEGLGMVRRDS